MRKTMWTSLAIALVALLISVTAWNQVPNPMPIHWNASGEANGFASRTLGLLLMPALSAAVTALLVWVGSRKAGSEGERKGMAATTIATALFMLAMHVLMVQAAMREGLALSLGMLMPLMGIFFGALGLVMPMLPQNRFAGVRTPWTLADEVNWKLTHRFARWTMLSGGLLCLLSGLLLSGPVAFWGGFSAIMIGSLAPVAASYAIHRMRS
jgi:uncharacterized membrane protein